MSTNNPAFVETLLSRAVTHFHATEHADAGEVLERCLAAIERLEASHIRTHRYPRSHMLDALFEIGRFALNDLAVPVGASVLTLLAGSKVSKWRAAGSGVADHDRRAAEINEDFRRWMRDRDRQAAVRMNEIAEQARVKGVALGGTLPAAKGKVYRHVLHECRDRASIAQREFDAFLAAEGRSHGRLRRRKRLPVPELVLPDDCQSLLAEWRQRAEDDPSRPELEPRLAVLDPLRPAA